MNRQANISARPSAVAGRFFPGDAGALRAEVDDCLKTAGPPVARPRAVISPHAGYPFSGRLTAAALNATVEDVPERIVVLSPSHRHAFEGCALPSQDRYAMPGFETHIDGAARDMLVNSGLAHVEDAAHDQEHGIETQLPFLHRLHPGVKVVPVVIGRASEAQVAALVDALAALGDRPPLFVLSSDLSHFLTLEEAEARDAATAKLIETGEADRLTGSDACGAAGIRGFVASRYGQGLRVQRLAMANSAAVTRDPGRTVGYGAWALFDATAEILLPDERAALLNVARQALMSRVHQGRMPQVNAGSFAPSLRGQGAAFVTLRMDGGLRGCVGSLLPHQPLVSDVAENAVKAGFSDPRFAPVTLPETERIAIKIAVLSPSAPMDIESEADLLDRLVPGRDGLVLRDAGRRGVFLPMVWESLPEPGDFLSALKRKAGLPQDHWSETLQVERFCAESFAEAV